MKKFIPFIAFLFGGVGAVRAESVDLGEYTVESGRQAIVVPVNRAGIVRLKLFATSGSMDIFRASAQFDSGDRMGDEDFPAIMGPISAGKKRLAYVLPTHYLSDVTLYGVPGKRGAPAVEREVAGEKTAERKLDDNGN